MLLNIDYVINQKVLRLRLGRAMEYSVWFEYEKGFGFLDWLECLLHALPFAAVEEKIVVAWALWQERNSGSLSLWRKLIYKQACSLRLSGLLSQ